MRLFATFLVGLLFGLGLVVSGMTNPANIVGFLDLAGDWNPSLIVVMASALSVAFVGYRIVLARRKPLLADTFQLPKATAIDRKLIIGSAMFGVGWGMSGLCPGPAIAAAATGALPVFAYLAAMIAGMAAHEAIARRQYKAA
jgi:hypothetical protein